MRKPTLLYTLLVTIVLMLVAGQTMADEIRVAVASNFSNAIKHIAERFEANTQHKVTLIFGSTGKHYRSKTARPLAPFSPPM